ncbi:MAG: hypothetical protein LBO74_17385 [Candidatus Symbiothrix sp.]|jgi:hypothetical protein|nr:hypothetical protein [Candidatus Symbiothrix sp.]
MAQAVGIRIERNARGMAHYAHIDLTKYGEMLMPFFKEVGIEKEVSSYNKEYVKMIGQAEKDIKAGKGKKIAIADLWK